MRYKHLWRNIYTKTYTLFPLHWLYPLGNGFFWGVPPPWIIQFPTLAVCLKTLFRVLETPYLYKTLHSASALVSLLWFRHPQHRVSEGIWRNIYTKPYTICFAKNTATIIRKAHLYKTLHLFSHYIESVPLKNRCRRHCLARREAKRRRRHRLLHVRTIWRGCDTYTKTYTPSFHWKRCHKHSKCRIYTKPYTLLAVLERLLKGVLPPWRGGGV